MTLYEHVSALEQRPVLVSGLPSAFDKAALARPPSSFERWAKRATDVVIAALALLLLLPLVLPVIAAIALTSPGPVLLRQQREGQGGRLFGMYKFRSMFADCSDASGTRQATSGDPRVTPVGRLLRRTNVDELPQLINVLLGDMSLVGPRPHVPGMLAAGMPYRELVAGYDGRLDVKPGITGLAQVNGLRGPTSDPVLAVARIEHDLAYVGHWSLALDLRIMVLTVWREAKAPSGV